VANPDLSCPFCQSFESGTADKVGEYCALIQYYYNEDRPESLQALLQEHTVKRPTVILKEHGAQVTPEAYVEALSMLDNHQGMIKEVSVPGHWGIQNMPGSWAAKGKGQMHEAKE
jgi:hypothetical protein